MSQVTLFISAVSNEFAEDPSHFPDRVGGAGDYRTYLRDKLTGPDVSVKIQENFAPGGVLTLDKLVLYLKECDAVIQLVGDMTGAVASELAVESLFASEAHLPRKVPFLATPADAARLGVSYTQWEGYLAHHYGRRLLVCAAKPEAPRAGKHAVLPEQRASQDAHLERLEKLERYAEISFASREELAVEVLRMLRTMLPRAQGEVLGAAPLKLPYTSLGELFIGRDQFLAGIRASVAKAKKAGTWPKQVVHGLGGMGKTRLAVEYAWRYRDEYSAVLMVNGESPEALDRELASLAGTLQIDVDSSTPEPRRTQLALEWLGNHPGWLLIVDNIDSEDAREAVAARLPDWSNGHVLITGRITRWPRDVEPLDLHVLSPDDATRFLLEATQGGRAARGDDSVQGAALANEELGALCLALEQASAYINKLGLSLGEYRKRWATNAKDVRKRADKSLMRYHEEKDVSLSVATTWQTTVDNLSAQAKATLQMLAWLSPDEIPLAMLELPQMTEQLDALTGEAGSDVEEALAELRSYSLLSRSQSSRFDSAGQVHRLVQVVTRDSLDASARGRTLEAMLAVITAYIELEEQHIRLTLMDELPSHLEVAIEHGEKAALGARIAPLLRAHGELFHNRSVFKSAIVAYERALSIDEAQNGPAHPDVAEDLRRLSDVLVKLNRLEDAEPHLRRALSIIENNYGADHQRVMWVLNSLFDLLCEAERLDEMEAIALRAIRISEHHHGLDHYSAIESLLDLAVFYWHSNRLGESIEVYRRTLAISERHHGVDSLDANHVLGGLATILGEAGEREEAERLFRRVLAIYERTIGTSNPVYGQALRHLARLLSNQGRAEEAEPLIRSALALSEKALDETHPSIIMQLSAHTQALASLGRYAEEEPLARRLVAITSRAYPAGHEYNALAHRRLALNLQFQGRFDEAEASFRRALEVVEEGGGKNSERYGDLTGIAHNVYAQGRYEEAESLYQHAIDAWDVSRSGEEAVSLAIQLLGRSRALRRLDRDAEAEGPMRHLVSIAEREFSPGHWMTARGVLELAQLLVDLDRSGEAAPLFDRAYSLVSELPEMERSGYVFPAEWSPDRVHARTEFERPAL